MPLVPRVNQQHLDANGDPLSGGTLTFSESGSATAKTVYSDAALTTSLGSSVTLDSLGLPASGGNVVNVFGSGEFRVVLKNSGGTTIWTLDELDAGVGTETTGIIWGGTSGGTANAQTITPSPAIDGYEAGQIFAFIAGATNSTTMTLNVNAKGAKAVNHRGTALGSDTITSGEVVIVIYDGTDFELLTAVNKATVAETRGVTTGAHAITADLLQTAAASVALTDATTVAVDWSAGIYFTLTLTADRTLGNPTNEVPGTFRIVLVEGNNTTDRTLSFDTEYGGTTPSLTDIDSTQKYLLTIFCKEAGKFLVTSIDGAD